MHAQPSFSWIPHCLYVKGLRSRVYGAYAHFSRGFKADLSSASITSEPGDSGLSQHPRFEDFKIECVRRRMNPLIHRTPPPNEFQYAGGGIGIESILGEEFLENLRNADYAFGCCGRLMQAASQFAAKARIRVVPPHLAVVDIFICLGEQRLLRSRKKTLWTAFTISR